MTTDDHQISLLCDAVIAVWSDVLETNDISATDKLGPRCTNVAKALRAVSLMNQWLGAELTLRDILSQGTPAMVARKLHNDGIRPPCRYSRGDHTSSSTDLTRGDWEVFWDSIYRFSRPESNGEFNSAGWFDRKTLSPIPQSTMLEWVLSTVDRIRQLNPQKILDVGCGAGLLMHQLIDHCTSYVGVDYSREAVNLLRRNLAGRSKLNVDVIRTDAAEVVDLVDQEFDLVIVNSVIQYFPDQDYLQRCFERLASVLSRTGAIFCGDVLNSDLHVATHVYHALNKYTTDAPASQVKRAVAASVNSDAVLTLSPAQFRNSIAQIMPDLSFRSLVRRGTEKSPMNLFRYDSLISKEFPNKCIPGRSANWRHAGGVPIMEVLPSELKDTSQTLIIRGARDARSFPYVRMAKALDNAPPGATLGDIRDGLKPVYMVDPNEVWDVGHRLGFGVAVSPDLAHPGTINLAFCRNASDWDTAALLS